MTDYSDAELRRFSEERVPPAVRPRQVAFLHIMKTAGTSVQLWLRTVMPGIPVFPGDENRFDEANSGTIANYGLVMGHFSWRHVGKFRDPFLITFLRDPVERVLSFYSHVAHLPVRNDDSEEVVAVRSLSLGEFLRCEEPIVARYVEDHQAWALADDWRAPRGTLTQGQVAERALVHLAQMDFVGLAERSDDEVLDLAELFNVRSPGLLGHENRTENRLTRDQLSAADMAVLLERNSADFIVYQWALKRRLERARNGRQLINRIAARLRRALPVWA